VVAVQSATLKTASLEDGTSLRDYWVSHGWSDYRSDAYSETLRVVRVSVQGEKEVDFPADRVWREGASVALTSDRIVTLNVRAAIASDPGWLILSADYSQLEVRILAHFAQDEELLRILAMDGGDVFIEVAARWLEKPAVAVTPEERAGAKRIVYGVLYGMGEHGIAMELGISVAEARTYISTFHNAFPGINSWKRRAVEEAHRTGVVETILGRRRRLPGLASPRKNEKEKAERQAVNSIMQGSAADLMKVASVRVWKKLRGSGSGRILLQIHDELLLEVRAAAATAVRDFVAAEMIGVTKLRVPLRVKTAVGPNWGDLRDKQEH
jgi:DNA polymerase I-like protein with 3'-5' exonuclease and polymerase domains